METFSACLILHYDSLTMNKQLLKKGYWAALFSILMIVIGPLVSQTIAADVFWRWYAHLQGLNALLSVSDADDAGQQ